MTFRNPLRKLRVAIDCRIADPRQGVGTAVLALGKALSCSQDAHQEYTFIVPEKMAPWLEPYIFGACSLQTIPEPPPRPRDLARRLTSPLRSLRKTLSRRHIVAALSDNRVESQRFDVVHFPTQEAYITKLPTIYQPWDLQHLHYPQFFSKIEIQSREVGYRAYCDQASFVCVQAEWTKRDIVRCFGIPQEKVVVIPWGPVFDAYDRPSEEEVRSTLVKLGVSSTFFFYPAAAWPHKNHEALIRAIHILKRKHGIVIDVIFTGKSTNHRSTLDRLAKKLGVEHQLRFLGFLTPMELQVIFGRATAMVFPSKFEGFGLPILEAFHAGVPVLSSNATTLPEIAGNGALYFDPDSPSELADLMKNLLSTPELRADLVRKGNQVLAKFSTDQMARSFQELYERAAATADSGSGRLSRVAS